MANSERIAAAPVFLSLKLSHGTYMFRGWILPGHREMFFLLWKSVRCLGWLSLRIEKLGSRLRHVIFRCAALSYMTLWATCYLLECSGYICLPIATWNRYSMTHILFQCWGPSPLRSHELWWWGRTCADDFCHAFLIPRCRGYGTKVTVQVVSLCKHSRSVHAC